MTGHTAIPRPGMFATLRNRRGVIAGVQPFDGDGGRIHLVDVEYKDDQLPAEEQVLWELEPAGSLLEPTALPNTASSDPMPSEDFDALLRAARWTATSPYLDPDGEGPVERLPVSSPFHGAVHVEDYQLVPLLKALQMPRVNLLIADDVGLGKTIEAGLILTELLLRRRVQRVLILTPASLRPQWKEEMWDKFSLDFDVVDRDETHKLRKRLGMDANPWRSFSRIIASYHYLRQDDVLEQFRSASVPDENSPHLPWDLLIVDECHNLMPSAFGDDSDLCQMLRQVAPLFEHRLFLSATPHNGHTRCFSGLLEILDPVRFSQTDELKPAEKARVEKIVLRRLKREINERTNPPKFCTRMPPKAVVLDLAAEEAGISQAFQVFRAAVGKLISSGARSRRRSGRFAVEILGKRLLSCPVAFAESWRRSREGLAEDKAASDSEVAASERSVRQETGDDREAQKREDTAAGVVGAWLKAVAGDLSEEIAAIDQAVCALGLDIEGEDLVEQDPNVDARFDALCDLIDDLLRDGKHWRDDERLIVFTEYKTTLDYVTRRLRERYEAERILTLYGGMDRSHGGIDREDVKRAFNDKSQPVRILVATDAASEGLNLHETARYMLHYDCPWNPSKLEQRNGRLDRYGQARDVTIHHFVTDQDQDLKFLAHVIAKADEIREDLGSTNELFDEAARRRLVNGEDVAAVQLDLDRGINAARGATAIDADATVSATGEMPGNAQDLEAITAELDLDPEAMRTTLEAAMATRAGRPQLTAADAERTFRVLNLDLAGWSEVVDDSLRLQTTNASKGPVARMAFDGSVLLEDVGGRLVFSPRPDVLLMHLSHPMLQKALSVLTRQRFPGAGAGESVSRWTVRKGPVPEGCDGLIRLSVEELAVNDLRETFHHWVRTITLPVKAEKLGQPLAHVPARELEAGALKATDAEVAKARDMMEDVEPDMKRFLQRHAERLSKDLRRQLEADGEQAKKLEDERYRSRQGEVSSLIAETTLAKLEREVEKLKADRAQGKLFGEADALDQLDRSIDQKQEEIQRRKRHYQELREQLEKERERILKHLLPNRHSMSGSAQAFPVTIEIVLPGDPS